MDARIVSADQVDPQALDRFLHQAYRPPRAAFLREHGHWWHGGDHNRWVLLVGEVIAGYCAVIPTRVRLQGNPIPALWWVDLVIAPEFRGRGLQTLFDEKIRMTADLKLGFPNQLAAKIHRKQPWGVRENLDVRVLPLQPFRMKAIRQAQGLRGSVLRAAALAVEPLAALFRGRLGRYQPAAARLWPRPEPGVLAEIFARSCPDGLPTTERDAAYFERRFLDAPYRDDLDFYLSGPEARPTHYLVARRTDLNGVRAVRILDLFGDWQDPAGFQDLIRLAASRAVTWGASQVMVMVSSQRWGSGILPAGFWLRGVGRFCWHSSSRETMEAMHADGWWTLADSDNDAPE